MKNVMKVMFVFGVLVIQMGASQIASAQSGLDRIGIRDRDRRVAVCVNGLNSCMKSCEIGGWESGCQDACVSVYRSCTRGLSN